MRLPGASGTRLATTGSGARGHRLEPTEPGGETRQARPSPTDNNEAYDDSGRPKGNSIFGGFLRDSNEGRFTG